MSELEDRINSILSSPEEMEKLTKMAQSLMAGGSEGSVIQESPGSERAAAPENPLGELGIDPGALASIGRIMSASGAAGGSNHTLLEAMKPYLSEKRRDKLARAMQLAKMAKLAGAAFSEYGGTGDV